MQGEPERSPEAPEGEEPKTPFDPDLIRRERVTSTRPGDRAFRIVRSPRFRRAGPGVLQPRPRALEPTGGLSRTLWRLKRILIGEPIPTDREVHERLTKVKALAILSSDALSSVAYGPEAVMRTLVVVGVAALSLTMPIVLAVTVLLAIVATSYRQTIRAYPKGGGSYIVAHDNLGVVPGLVAASSLLVDYVLTVSVSVAAGIDALRSAFAVLRPYSVELGILSIALIALVNLRGIRESGTIFAAPTYVFVFSLLIVIAIGLARLATTGIPYQPGPAGPTAGTEPLTWFLILSAFARGCTAMTGTEAISDGLPAFKPPEWKNGQATLTWMAVLLGAMLLGVAFLVTRIGIVPVPDESQTILSQLTRLVVGDGWFYLVVTLATTLILFLAANTSFSDFPRLLNFLARDRYAPRWFALRGDRLAFTFGILGLAFASGFLLFIFGGNVTNLLPLYAVGVFTSFTLSQSGMVTRWLRSDDPHRRRSATINGVGAVATALVTIVIILTKFSQGAWIVVILVILLVLTFLGINRHYRSVARQLGADVIVRPSGRKPLVIVPVASLSLIARRTLAFARDLSPRVVGVHVATDPGEAERLRADWHAVVGDVPLVVIESPYRVLYQPLLAYIDSILDMSPGEPVVVLLPEFVASHWWENLLHNQTAVRLKAALLYRPRVVVADFPYHLRD